MTEETQPGRIVEGPGEEQRDRDRGGQREVEVGQLVGAATMICDEPALGERDVRRARARLRARPRSGRRPGETTWIDGWIPIFLFALLFGLSMDYEVFLLSRIREEWDRRHDNEQAVAYGLEHTGRIITAAAIIMVAAFAGFVAGSFPALQEFGLGLSVAIFLDATVVRAILVPATMKLLGGGTGTCPSASAARCGCARRRSRGARDRRFPLTPARRIAGRAPPVPAGMMAA